MISFQKGREGLSLLPSCDRDKKKKARCQRNLNRSNSRSLRARSGEAYICILPGRERKTLQPRKQVDPHSLGR